MATIIHILLIEHEHGIDVSAHRSNETAYAALAKYCREFWQNARDQVEELSETPSGVDKIVVTCYFNALEDTAKAEHWEIRVVALED